MPDFKFILSSVGTSSFYFLDTMGHTQHIAT